MKCYNCENNGITREHIIPRFLLLKNESGLTISCCETCQSKLKWLDDYAADYFRFQNSLDSIDEWEKWYRQAIVQNGSPMALRLFGEDVVINEDILMHFIHKVCVGISYHLYGKLGESYSLSIITNFSKLGGYCHYNTSEEKSYTEDQTNKILNSRDKFFRFFSQIINQHSITVYQVKNVKLTYTENITIHGAKWFMVNLYEKFSLICAVVNGLSPKFAQSRNMLFASLPTRIDLSELEQCRKIVKQTDRGDSIVENFAISPISNDSRAVRKEKLIAAGVSIQDIEIFESSLTDLIENKGGKERLAKMFLDGFRGQSGLISNASK